MEFPLLRELLEEGATDLLASPLVFTSGDVHAALWTTCQPGGFTDEQIAGIQAIVEPFARVAEVRALRRTATNLLDTYVGHRTGDTNAPNRAMQPTAGRFASYEGEIRK